MVWSSETYAENVRKCISGISKRGRNYFICLHIVGGLLTTAANAIANKGLIDKTVMVGGMNLPMVLSAVLNKR